MEIQVFSPVSENKKDKYPVEIAEVSAPFKEGNENFVFYPLTIKRTDIGGKKIELKFLEGKAGNKEKIAYVTRQHKHYFEENTVNESLILPASSTTNFESSLQESKDKQNYFIYDFNGNLKFNDKEVFSSIEQLKTAIKEFLKDEEIKNRQKIVILIVPSNYNNPQQAQPVDTATTIDTLTSASKEDTPKEVVEKGTVEKPKKEIPESDHKFLQVVCRILLLK
ncbi:MAG: hypothetical protein IPP60_03670 [Sphingobacteriales bacterium]|nr:hypothetical protein [Sphingobacteriales bacterium]